VKSGVLAHAAAPEFDGDRRLRVSVRLPDGQDLVENIGYMKPTVERDSDKHG
jgi:hypothetical protein